MGKRSNFERRERDFYPTPYEAVVPLLPFLPAGTRFIEPCAGAGDLIHHLAMHGHECVGAFDVEPKAPGIVVGDAFDVMAFDADYFITNPPWDRATLHPLITHLSEQRPTWLLFDADWMHTKQSAELMRRCEKIVSVGRVKWIPDSKMTGKDNCCWYLFDREATGTEFLGRAA